MEVKKPLLWSAWVVGALAAMAALVCLFTAGATQAESTGTGTGTTPTAISTITSAPTTTATSTATATATPICQPWSEVAQYPTTAFSLMAASLNGKVYGFGGRDANYTRLTNAYEYDPATNGWTQLASMPQIDFWGSAVAANGMIYIINGSHDMVGSNNSSIYDPATNSWNAGPNGLEATYGESAVYLNGNIYRIGGLGSSGYLNTLEDYGQMMLAPMPQGIAWGQAAAIGGYIYVAGGNTDGGFTNKTYRYDPAANSWDDNAIADMPVARAWAASGVVGGKWVIAGGLGTEGSAVEWDPQTNSWSNIAPPLFPRSDMGGAVAGDKLYLVGGLSDTRNEVTSRTQRYDPAACQTPSATPTVGTTAVVTETPTATHVAGTATRGATITATQTPTSIASPTATACSLQFNDVPQGSTFYPYIRCLACLGIINGYPDGTFKPNNSVTRGQLSKIVSNSAGFQDNQTTQMFQDVPVGSTFFQYIGRLASRGFIGGYPCGGPGEPCGPGSLPYFRPNNNATRGQISKIVANAAAFSETPSGQQFEDVPVGSTYYTFTYRLTLRNIMQGYPCGGPGEPCEPGNMPYFRPNNNATRGQTSKIAGGAFFQDCNVRKEP